ncbi:hypothetical protein A9Q88_00630 [Gammaproteobacteria bacterium 50_400_T64]|nr:hypothetical protein A9Q88_00630 [Gammaproteobacteria bacterium 50_400_T64]
MKNLKFFALCTAFLSLITLGACSGEKGEIELGAEQEKAMSERLAPAGEVSLVGEVSSAPAATSSDSSSRSGDDVYNKSCKTCHGAGMAGAPKFGAPDQWTARIDKGMDILYVSAISGFQGMPPKGLCMDCSDDELKAAVDYMVDGSK